MQGIATILTGLLMVSAAMGCSGRARRPTMAPAPTSAATGTKTQEAVVPETPPAATTDSTESTTTTEDTLGDRVEEAPEPAPDDAAPGEDEPAASGGAGGGGAAGGEAPLRITTTLDDGTQSILEWDGKSMQGNGKFDVANFQ